MFKPTLKRSKLNEISTFSSSNRDAISIDFLKDRAQLIENAHNTDLYIPSLISKGALSEASQGQPKIISPFNYWDLQYPIEVKEKLNLTVKSRLIGSKFGVFWFITQNELYLWRYESEENPTTLVMQRKFQFEKNIRAIAIGHLDQDQCSLFNIKQNCQTMAIGFEHIIDLYTINLKSLELQPVQIRLKVEFKQSLEKLEITERNQIFFTGDQGYLTKVSFNSFNILGFPKVNKSNARPSIFSSKSIWPSFQFSKTKSKIFTERILGLKNGKIYVLIRKESQGSYLHRLGLSIFRFFSGKIRNEETSIFIQKEIHVYSITDSKRGTIKFNGVIKNSEIEQKIKQSYSEAQLENILIKNEQKLTELNSNSITNIIVSKTKRADQDFDEKLSIVTSYGLILTLRENISLGIEGLESFGFEEGPKSLPRELFVKNKKILSTALFLRSLLTSQQIKNESLNLDLDQFEPLTERAVKILFSLGPGNFNLLSNGLCFYFDERQLQILKLNKQPGYILENSHQLSSKGLQGTSSWLVFSKSEMTFIRKSQPFQHILTTLDALNELKRHGLSNGEKSQQYEVYMNSSMHEIHRILGNVQTCKALSKILMLNLKQRLSEPIQQNTKGEKIVRVSIEAREVAKEEQKQRIKLSNRLKYQTLTNQDLNSFFPRWLIPKRKESQPHLIAINQDIELTLWKYLMVYSLEKNQGREVAYVPAITFEDKIMRSLPTFPAYLIEIFKNHYNLIKSLSLAQIKRAPRKIKEVKLFFSTLLAFLQQKKAKSFSLMHNFSYLKPETITFGKGQLNTSSTTDRSVIELHPNNYSWVNSSTPNSFRLENHFKLRSPTEDISNEICKIIPNLLTTIELYQILASSSQQKYSKLPTIAQFMESFASRSEVKAAILDLFSSTDISTQGTILKFSNALPQLRLESDIYLAKWLKFIGRGQNDKQYDSKFSVSSQIRLSDLNQLSKRLQISQVKKIKQLFNQNSSLYLRVLSNQLRFRKLQYKLIEEVIKNKKEALDEAEDGKNLAMETNLDHSIFQWDRQKLNNQWKGWLNSEIIEIRNQITTYLRELANRLNLSTAGDFMEREKVFDDSIKVVINQCEEGMDFRKDLIIFLRENRILPEKSYRLSLATTKNPENPTSNLLQNNVRPESMSTFALLNNSLRKNKDLFANLNTSATEQEVKKEPETVKKTQKLIL